MTAQLHNTLKECHPRCVGKLDRWEGSQKQNLYDINDVYSKELISKHFSAIHGHHQVFLNQFRFHHTNRVTEL